MLEQINNKIASDIFQQYKKSYDGETQGCCPVIALDISKAINGQIVLGYIQGYTFKREHWWVEKDDIIYDPMGDEYSLEPGFKRIEIHRNKKIIKEILPYFMQYKIIGLLY